LDNFGRNLGFVVLSDNIPTQVNRRALRDKFIVTEKFMFVENFQSTAALERNCEREVRAKERFEFGRNWLRFLAHLSEERIARAAESLKTMLETDNLEGKSFLDIGCGSGLFSLAARRLGARVHSFDYDPDSVGCARELKQRFFSDDTNWTIERGSALDENYLRALGRFDVVYSWGVLHHTGAMWRALELVAGSVADEGKLFIAIYNDTGSQAARWRKIKRIYNRLPRALQPVFAALAVAPQECKSFLRAALALRPLDYVRSWTQYEKNRGMNRWHDIVDWVGGYPYEVATADEIFDFYRARGFALRKLKTGGVGLGCNEFVFARESHSRETR
jgi:2-polyprenyl-3-methyl-5-hydroxy-6-metoxy-1,4-benzoquinol methylase